MTFLPFRNKAGIFLFSPACVFCLFVLCCRGSDLRPCLQCAQHRLCPRAAAALHVCLMQCSQKLLGRRRNQQNLYERPPEVPHWAIFGSQTPLRLLTRLLLCRSPSVPTPLARARAFFDADDASTHSVPSLPTFLRSSWAGCLCADHSAEDTSQSTPHRNALCPCWRQRTLLPPLHLSFYSDGTSGDLATGLKKGLEHRGE